MEEKPDSRRKPRFCVFCGITLPTGDVVTRCPGCAELVPEQFLHDRPPPRASLPPPNIDKSMSFCIYCGEFIDKTSMRTGKCCRCRKNLPPAPSALP